MNTVIGRKSISNLYYVGMMELLFDFLVPEHPYPLIVGPSSPNSPISFTISL